MNSILDRVLQAARQLGASDVHLKAGLPPIFRIKGDLRTVRDVPPLTRDVLQTCALGMVMRLIPPDVPAFEKLNLPRSVLQLAEAERGLVLVTGATGSGKSTT